MPCWPSFWALSKLPVEVFVWTHNCGYGSLSAAPEAQPGSAFSEMPPPSCRLQHRRKWGKVQIRATVTLSVWQVKQKGEQALICDLSHVTFLWLKALTELGTRLHTRALSHGNAPAPAQAVPQKQGYRITQVSSLFPFLNFYSVKVMRFRESIKFG